MLSGIPYLKNKQLPRVQRRATKMIPKLKDLTYQKCLKELKLPTVQYRQLRGDLIQSYKIVHKMHNANCDDFFILNSNNTRNSEFKIYKGRATSKITHFLPYRVNNLWNSLSAETKRSKSINIFKSSIDRELSHLTYNFYEYGVDRI